MTKGLGDAVIRQDGWQNQNRSNHFSEKQKWRLADEGQIVQEADK